MAYRINYFIANAASKIRAGDLHPRRGKRGRHKRLFERNNQIIAYINQGMTEENVAKLVGLSPQRIKAIVEEIT